MDLQEVALLDLEPRRHELVQLADRPGQDLARRRCTARRPRPRQATTACGTAPAAPPTGSRPSRHCRCRPRTPGCATGSSARRCTWRSARATRRASEPDRPRPGPARPSPRRAARRRPASGRSCPSESRRGSASRRPGRARGSQSASRRPLVRRARCASRARSINSRRARRSSTALKIERRGPLRPRLGAGHGQTRAAR